MPDDKSSPGEERSTIDRNWRSPTNLGVKDFRAVTEDNKPLSLKAQVTDADKPLLSVAHIVHNGGKVVFSPEANYIEHKSKGGGIRRDNLIFRDGLYVIKLWVPRDQGAPFTGQA